MESLNPIEREIYNYLNRSPRLFVSATEVSRNVGPRKWFHADRSWARPILRRLEMEGWLESNPFGEYRLRKRAEEPLTFGQALKKPGAELGNTTIITEETAEGSLPNAPETDQRLRTGS